MRITADPPVSPSGHTLLELVVVLSLFGLAVAQLLPAAGRQRNRMAVLGAREAVAGLLHRARGEAVARGGVEVSFLAEPPLVQLVAPGDTLERVDLQERYGVTLALSRGRTQARVAFGPLGLGRVASQTLRFQRGGEEVRLVVSALGRVARR